MKNTRIIIILIAVFFILGCDRLRAPEADSPLAIDYHSGTKGIEIEVVKGLPPDEVLEGNDFVIGLELRNRGAYDVEGARISVYGFERGYINVDDPVQTFNIEGKKPGFPEGGYEIINFNAHSLGMPEVLEEYKTAYTIQTYYTYQTLAGTEICINPNIYSYLETRDAICKTEDIQLSGGQGAPVAVTKIEQTYNPSGNKMKVNFFIQIENKGDGEVVGAITIKDVRLSNVPLSCDIPYIEELEKGEKEMIGCSAEIFVSSGTYFAPLSINLEYDYTSKVSKLLKIRSLRARSS